MADYPFDLVRDEVQLDAGDGREAMRHRPFVHFESSLEAGARHFVPGEQLENAINTAIAVGLPLLISGESGTGKTQTAYYIARKLGLGEVIHFQVKSTSRAQDLLYAFDTVRYFRDAWGDAMTRRQVASEATPDDRAAGDRDALSREPYVEAGPLWQAIAKEPPRVLLIDEIDKAPNDFPNDLLFELDEMKFKVPELDRVVASPDPSQRPIVVITSNRERRLPEPFLRRCAFHHIKFDEALLEKAVERRKEQFRGLDDGFIRLALERFLALRAESLNLRKPPSTGEYLVWLRVLALRLGNSSEALNRPLDELPFLSLLVKHREDLKRLQGGGT